MDKREIVEHLCSRGHRGSTTGNEEWAASEINGLFRDHDIGTETQEFMGNKTYGEKLTIHLSLAICAALIPFFFPDLIVAGVILLVLLIFSYSLEAILFVEVFSRIFPKGPSRNVLGKMEYPGAVQRILFVAHYDSQKEGFLFSPKLVDLMKRFASPDSRITPIHLTFLSIIFLCLSTAFFQIDIPEALEVPHLIGHVLIMLWALFALILVLQWTVNSRYVPGANDNATGVVVMLDLAGKYATMQKEGTLPEVNLWFLASSCEETGLGGSLDFIDRHEDALREKETFIVCLDGLGYGDLHYFTADGILRTRAYDKDMIALAEGLARDRFPEVRPFICRVFTDGLAFSTRGYRAITFGCLDREHVIKNYHWRTDTPENVDYKAMERAQEYIEAFVERLIKK